MPWGCLVRCLLSRNGLTGLAGLRLCLACLQRGLVCPRVCPAHCIPCISALPCARQASTPNSQQTSSKSSSLHVSVDLAEASTIMHSLR